MKKKQGTNLSWRVGLRAGEEVGDAGDEPDGAGAGDLDGEAALPCLAFGEENIDT